MAQIPVLIDAYSAYIGLLILLALFAAFISERFPPVVVAVARAAAMLLFGYLSAARLEAVFSNPAPITIGAMFVLSGALVRTGVVEAMAGYVSGRAGVHPRLSLLELFGGTFLSSALVNNTPVVLILIPIVKRIAQAVGTTAKRLLIPLSYISIMGGSLTLIGTSTNLLVDGVAQRAGEPAFGIFELTPIGLVAAGSGFLMLLLLGKILLPHDAEGDDTPPQDELFITDLTVRADSSLIGTAPGEWSAMKRAGVRLLGIKRGNVILRGREIPDMITVGDTLLAATTDIELLSLCDDESVDVGIGRRALRSDKDGDLPTVSAAIGPAHPAIGRRLAEIPFLARLHVRVLGIARARHLAGPSLGEARLRAGDRLLIAGDPSAVAALRENVNLTEVSESQTRSFRRVKAPIVLLTMLGVIGLAALGVTTIETLAIMGVAVVLLTRCIDAEEAWQCIDGSVLVLIFGMLAVGVGLQNSGTVDLIVSWVSPLLQTAPIFLTLIIIYALTSTLTEIVTNNAVAVLMAPIVLGLASQLGVDPRPLLLAVMFGASASFATPIGYQTNTLVYAAGNYKFADFVKIGLPMNIVVGLASCAAIYLMV
ncbi:MAG: SLC13 family permease [Pacificimonas sp.]